MEPLKSGRANLLRGAESVGGKLILEGRHLRFAPHAVNVQREPVALFIADIRRVEPTWTRFLGKVPLAPNAVRIVMSNQEAYEFTVSGRKAWIQEIEHARADTPRG